MRSLLDQPNFEPDEELKAFIEEYEATNGKMYQNRNLDPSRLLPDKIPIRPKYYGRKPSTTLRPARVQKLLTQSQLAARSGTTRRTITKIENTRYEPSVYLALALAQALNVKVEDIFHLPYITPVSPSKY